MVAVYDAEDAAQKLKAWFSRAGGKPQAGKGVLRVFWGIIVWALR
jgi:hypothetical protein